MEAAVAPGVVRQHLIDPEICIRCNTCEATCPVGAITHDARNYVVDVDKCKMCLSCIPPCPTGSIDNWRTVARAKAYSVDEQLSWDSLPAELSAEQLAAEGLASEVVQAVQALTPTPQSVADADAVFHPAHFGATMPPWSAAHPYVNLYGPKAAQKSVTATVVGNVRVCLLYTSPSPRD